MKHPKLFIPGPTHVPNDVLQAMAQDQIGHRTPAISILIKEIKEGIQKVLYTQTRILLTSNPATALWEMGIVNSVSKGILHAVNGAFSSKWALVSEKCNFNNTIIDYEWGKGVKVDDVDRLLSTGKFDTFAMVHNETSTGVMSNLEDISELLKTKYPDIIWLVDAVSSMAGIKIEVDKLGIDFILSSTQKAWGLPAGFSVCSVSDKIYQKSKTLSNKGYYFDLMTYDKSYEKDQTPTTPSISHLFGLQYILRKINDEGLENRWNRHIEMAHYTRDWAKNNGQSLFPENGCESYTLTCIENNQNWDINTLNEKLLDRGFRMDRGYGTLRCKAFRVAHMGNIYIDDLTEYLNLVDELLKEIK
jgi:aspartate aminotransferase-like enzyme